MIIISSIFAQNTLEITKSINLRNNPTLTSDVITYVIAGDKYKITDIKMAWYKVKIISGSQNTNKIGWIYRTCLELTTSSNAIVKNKGCTLRNSPKVSDNAKGYVINGAIVELLDYTASWYKIDRNIDSIFKTGWVCNMTNYVKLVK